MAEKQLTIRIGAEDAGVGAVMRQINRTIAREMAVPDEFRKPIMGPAIRPRFDLDTQTIRNAKAEILKRIHEDTLEAKVRVKAEVIYEKAKAEVFGDVPERKPLRTVDRSPFERSVRDEEARRIRETREESRRARVEEEADQRMFGGPRPRGGGGKNGGGGKGGGGGEEEDGAIEQLRGAFGRHGKLTEILHLATGAGPILGLGLAARELEHLTHAAEEFATELRMGEKPAGELTDHFLRQIPLLGNIYASGRAIREVISGEEAELRKANEEAARSKELWEMRINLAKSYEEQLKSLRDVQQEQGNRQAMIGATSPGRELESARQRAEADKKGLLEKDGEAAKERHAKDEEVRRKLVEERNKAINEHQQYKLNFEGEGNSGVFTRAGMEEKDRAVTQAQQALTHQDNLNGQRDVELTKSREAAINAIGETAAEERKQILADYWRETGRLNEAAAREIASQLSDSDADRLRQMGRAADAEIVTLRSKLDKELAEIELARQKANETNPLNQQANDSQAREKSQVARIRAGRDETNARDKEKLTIAQQLFEKEQRVAQQRAAMGDAEEAAAAARARVETDYNEQRNKLYEITKNLNATDKERERAQIQLNDLARQEAIDKEKAEHIARDQVRDQQLARNRELVEMAAEAMKSQAAFGAKGVAMEAAKLEIHQKYVDQAERLKRIEEDISATVDQRAAAKTLREQLPAQEKREVETATHQNDPYRPHLDDGRFVSGIAFKLATESARQNPGLDAQRTTADATAKTIPGKLDVLTAAVQELARRPADDESSRPSERNAQYAKPGPYNTNLSEKEEGAFRSWVAAQKVPFDVTAKGDTDYDMRGYWRAMQRRDPAAHTEENAYDGKPHFPDTFKTPLHKSFSNESIYARPNAPHWINDHQLADEHDRVVFDEARKESDRHQAVTAAEKLREVTQQIRDARDIAGEHTREGSRGEYDPAQARAERDNVRRLERERDQLKHRAFEEARDVRQEARHAASPDEARRVAQTIPPPPPALSSIAPGPVPVIVQNQQQIPVAPAEKSGDSPAQTAAAAKLASIETLTKKTNYFLEQMYRQMQAGSTEIV
jgi:hypothetical protein